MTLEGAGHHAQNAGHLTARRVLPKHSPESVTLKGNFSVFCREVRCQELPNSRSAAVVQVCPVSISCTCIAWEVYTGSWT
jgi:hypothetical protein